MTLTVCIPTATVTAIPIGFMIADLLVYLAAAFTLGIFIGGSFTEAVDTPLRRSS
jgi:hypothetical protein